MSFVTIDRDKCTLCGDCVDTCLFCFSEKDGEIIVDANEDNCLHCGHCVSICPADAVTHQRLNMETFSELSRPAVIDTETFVQFIKERRSHRRYDAKTILPAHFETLIEVCRFSATGDNLQGVQILVLQDKARIEKISGMVLDHIARITKRVEVKISELPADRSSLSEEDKFMLHQYQLSSALIKGGKEGRETIFWGAPAVMIFHAHSKLGTPKDDCVIAAQTVVLTARTMGLESCYCGALQITSQYNQPVMDELMLPPEHKVFSVLALGYPEQTYLKTVDRRPMKVRWE
ncbi:nitroreductase family protein [Thermodesulfobacteriota bacterium]